MDALDTIEATVDPVDAFGAVIACLPQPPVELVEKLVVDIKKRGESSSVTIKYALPNALANTVTWTGLIASMNVSFPESGATTIGKQNVTVVPVLPDNPHEQRALAVRIGNFSKADEKHLTSMTFNITMLSNTAEAIESMLAAALSAQGVGMDTVQCGGHRCSDGLVTFRYRIAHKRDGVSDCDATPAAAAAVTALMKYAGMDEKALRSTQLENLHYGDNAVNLLSWSAAFFTPKHVSQLMTDVLAKAKVTISAPPAISVAVDGVVHQLTPDQVKTMWDDISLRRRSYVACIGGEYSAYYGKEAKMNVTVEPTSSPTIVAKAPPVPDSQTRSTRPQALSSAPSNGVLEALAARKRKNQGGSEPAIKRARTEEDEIDAAVAAIEAEDAAAME